MTEIDKYRKIEERLRSENVKLKELVSETKG
jgi:hypothetical protein